jgi:tape measure domain-containing protein
MSADQVVTRYTLDPTQYVAGAQKVTSSTKQTGQAAKAAKQDIKSLADFVKDTGGDSGPWQDLVRAQNRLTAAMKTGNKAIIFDARHNYQKAHKSFQSAQDDMQPGRGGIRGFFDSINMGVRELDSAIPGLQEVLAVAKAIGYAVVGTAIAIGGLSYAAMRSAAEFESLELGLKAYSKTTAEYERNMRRLREVARMPGLGYREAISGSTRLQAAGFDARLAERALLSFGNALALVGGGKDDLDGILLALSQIATKGSISAEEINQIAERVPQIRQVMIDAFGTADSEKLTKMGIGPQKFIMSIIGQLERLEKATGGSKNSFENFGDVVDRITVQIGKALNKNLLPEFDKVAHFLDFMEEKDIFGSIVRNLFKATQGAKGLGGVVKEVLAIKERDLSPFISQASKFMGESDSLGGGMVRSIALVVATVEKLPDILEWTLSVIQTNLEIIRKFINSIIDLINGVLDQLINQGISMTVSLPGGRTIDVGKIGGEGNFRGFERLDRESTGIQYTIGQKLKGEMISNDIVKRARELVEGDAKWKSSNEIAGDKSLGGFRRTLDDIAENTKKTSDHTRPRREWGSRNIVGGGDLARLGVTPTEMRGSGSRGGAQAKFERSLRETVEALAGLYVRGLADIQTAQARF